MSTKPDSYIHSSLPDTLPRGTIVACVELGPLPKRADFREHLVRTGLQARVREVVQGDYRGEFLIVRPVYWSSCDSFREDARVGFLIGVPRRMEEGVLVVDPVRVWTLADEPEVSSETFRKAALPPLAPAQEPPSSAPVHGLRPWSLALIVVAAVAAWFALKRRRKQ
jgi:hypothetical protein